MFGVTVIMCVLITGILAGTQCPSGWVPNENNCYKFVDDKKIFEEADAACWSFGARLLSTDSYKEHSFVSNYLMASTLTRDTSYYTSGYYFLGRLFWEAIRQYDAGPGFWADNKIPPIEEKIYRVIYVYTGNGYQWSNITGGVPAGFICEVPRHEIQNLEFLDRDFDYGRDRTDEAEAEKGPVIIKQPEGIIVFDEISEVEVDCIAVGNPLPTYKWYRGSNFKNTTEVTSRYDNRYTMTGGKFTIQDPDRIIDKDLYHCKAENKIGSVFSDQAKLLFGYLGEISNVLPEPTYASVFRGVKLDCDTPQNHPRINYRWFKNAANNFVQPGNPNMFVSYTGALYVSEVQPTDAHKRYFCLITLTATDDAKLGKANPPSRSTKGVLLLLSPDSLSDNDYGPILHTFVFPTPILRGDKIRMECIAYGTHPLVYSWRREDGRPFVPGTKFLSLNRVLAIPNAPMEADGNYICTCKRKTGATASKVITINMETKPYFPYPIKNMLVDAGMTIKWNCRAVARPAATYTWYKNGVLLQSTPGHIEIRSNVLKILNIDSKRDEGMYQCAATNQHGTTFSTGQLKVLSFAPNFNRYPMTQTMLAPLGGNITIPCGVEGAPRPDVQWLKNGGNMNVMPGDLNGRIGMDIKHSLFLNNILLSDQALYTCKASNVHGEARNSTEIKAISGVVLTQSPVATTVQVNRTAFMHCQAAYGRNYDLTYHWNFNGYPINYQISPEYILGRQHQLNGLYITNAQFKHTGMYECVAITTIQSVRRSAKLTVQGPPGAPAGLYIDDKSITVRSVRMIWTVSSGIHHGSPITAYDIDAETNYHPGEWSVVAADVSEIGTVNDALTNGNRNDQRATNVTNLIPNTSYRFRVRAINTFGRGQEASSPSAWVKIAQTAPITAPRNVGGGGGKVGTLTITWDIMDPSEHCGPNLRYYIYWKKKSDQKTWKKEIGDKALALQEGKFVIVVGIDNYYLQYMVKVAAYNDNGHGPNSTVADIYSAEGMPNIVPLPQNSEFFNSTSVIMYWTPVPDTRESIKGRVAGYRIHYYADLYGEDPYGKEPDPIKNDIRTKDVYGQTDHVQLIGLVPGTVHYARVQVFNGAGFGPKGEWRRCKPANKPLKDHPTHVAVYQKSLHSVYVRWRGVGVYPGEDSLEGYKLRVWKIQADIRTAKDTIVGKVNEATVDGLQADTVYVIRVLGRSRAGEGGFSEAVYFSITGSDKRYLNIPIDSTVTRVCFSEENKRTCGSSTISGQYMFSPLLVLVATVLQTILS